MENGREEASGFGSTALRPLELAISLSPRLPFFYSFKKGAIYSINYLPNKSNYLGSVLYLILYYLHQGARTREEPVHTLS